MVLCDARGRWYIPKTHNELVGPKQPKEVIDEEVLHLLIPHHGVVACGVVGTLGIGQVCSTCRGWGWGWTGGWWGRSR